MLKIFDPYRDITFFSMILRLGLAVICSGIIGLERASKNRPAGLRTHILVCLGATIASMTGHFLYLNLHLPTDLSRIGAHVISGLGFLGAGTIIVTNRKTIKGLTTAASLWATGIVGLVIGAGFYEGGIAASVLIFLIQTIFSGAGYSVLHMPEYTLAVSYDRKNALDSVTRYCDRKGLAIISLKVTGSENDDPHYKAIISVRSYYNVSIEEVIEHLNSSGDCDSVVLIDKDE